MIVKRIVPNIESAYTARSREFYTEFLGLEVVMERDEIVTFASATNPTAQVSVVWPDELDMPYPNVSVEVNDVDKTYADALARGIEIVYPLTDEPWGVRRFFAIDPNGAVINVVSHL